MVIVVTIPGQPHAQCRPRTRVLPTKPKPRPVIYDPPCCKRYKALARGVMEVRMAALGFRPLAFPSGPLRVFVTVYFECPKSHRRSMKNPTPRRWHTAKPDAENVAKIVLDAANGVLWKDDSQVAVLDVFKKYAAQDEAPMVIIEVDNNIGVCG